MKAAYYIVGACLLPFIAYFTMKFGRYGWLQANRLFHQQIAKDNQPKSHE